MVNVYIYNLTKFIPAFIFIIAGIYFLFQYRKGKAFPYISLVLILGGGGFFYSLINNNPSLSEISDYSHNAKVIDLDKVKKISIEIFYIDRNPVSKKLQFTNKNSMSQILQSLNYNKSVSFRSNDWSVRNQYEIIILLDNNMEYVFEVNETAQEQSVVFLKINYKEEKKPIQEFDNYFIKLDKILGNVPD